MAATDSARAAVDIDSEGSIDAWLAFLRDPPRFVESAHEHFEIREREITCRTSLRLQIPDEHAGLDHVYLDVLHPDKGAVSTITVLTPGVSIAPHDEHIKIAERAIAHRFSSILHSAQFPANASVERIAETYAKFFEALQKALLIPAQPTQQAVATRKQIFSKSGVLEAFAHFQGMSYDNVGMAGLFRLCKTLSRKYYVILRIPVGKEAPRLVEFEASRQYTNNFVGPKGESKKWLPWRFYAYGALPNALRLHLPWAKRTAHYSCTSIAPDGQFYDHVAIVQRHVTQPALIEVSEIADVDGVSWSHDFLGGARLAAFIGSGRNAEQPFYLGIRHRELPGRSTLRVALISTMAILLEMLIMSMARNLRQSSWLCFRRGYSRSHRFEVETHGQPPSCHAPCLGLSQSVQFCSCSG